LLPCIAPSAGPTYRIKKIIETLVNEKQTLQQRLLTFDYNHSVHVEAYAEICLAYQDYFRRQWHTVTGYKYLGPIYHTVTTC